MRRFLSGAIIVLLLVGGAATLWQLLGRPKPGAPMVESVEQYVNPPALPPPARAPLDYHVLQDQGGIPKAEATRAGLAGAGYAYLCSMTPVQTSDGVAAAEGITVRGKRYDQCYRFETRPPAEQYLEYSLAAKWDTLDFGFGFTDTEPSDPSGKLAIVLEIQLDGKPVYTSPELRPTDKPLFTSLPVTGVNRLLIVVRRVGMHNLFGPVLLDPFLKTAAPSPAS
jgi:hypothetical protein